jgi:aminopeptidase N
LAEFIHQYIYAGKFLDRKEALEACEGNLSNPVAKDLVFKALKDPFYAIRSFALSNFANAKLDDATLTQIEVMAQKDDHKTVRADAIDILAKQKDKKYQPLFTSSVNDSSYSVAGAALEALADLDGKQAFQLANNFSKLPNKGRLTTAISGIIVAFGDETAFDFVATQYELMPMSQAKFNMTANLTEVLEKVNNLEKFKMGVDLIVKMRGEVPSSQRKDTDPFINNYFLKTLAVKKAAAGNKEMAAYIYSKIPVDIK